MSAIFQHSVRNRLLSALSPAAFCQLRPDLEPVDLPVRTELVAPQTITPYVYFMEAGLASVVASNRDGEEIEVGLVGAEGMSGPHVLLDVASTPNRTFMQVAGRGLRYPVPLLKEMLDDDPAARNLFLRYVHVSQVQLAQSALSIGRLNIHRRLARWLLMCADRLESDTIPLTHEFLALMMGIRRSGVTNEIHVLEGQKLIRASRAQIQLLKRDQLETLAGGGYGIPEREYERLIRPSTALGGDERSSMGGTSIMPS